MIKKKQEKKIWWKLALSYFLFTLGSLFLVALYLIISLAPQANMLRDEILKNRTEQLAALMSEEMYSGDGSINLQQALNLYSGPWDPQIWILDTEGSIVLQSPRARKAPSKPPAQHIEAALKGKAQKGVIPLVRTRYSASPIKQEGRIIGVLYVNFPHNLPLKNMLRAFIPLIKAFAFIAFLSIFISVLMARRIIRPLEQMTETARRLGEGALDSRVNRDYYSDEMEVLGETLNTMAEKLQNSLNTLENDKKRLEHMERMRRDLVASISHEIRTPLSTIQGCSEALQDGIVEGEDAEKYIDVIHKEVNHLNLLIGDLLELKKMEAKAVSLNRENIDLQTLIDEVVQSKHHELTRAEIKPLFSGEGLVIFVDKEKIRQVFLNLIANTLRYCPPQTKLTLAASQKDDIVEIIFEDRGPGVPEDDLTRLFEHFYRVEKSRSKSRGGYGLGLAIVKNIINLHGGEIKAENVESGGLRFIISLPAGSPAKKE